VKCNKKCYRSAVEPINENYGGICVNNFSNKKPGAQLLQGKNVNIEVTLPISCSCSAG
jgi:hypothetical protein